MISMANEFLSGIVRNLCEKAKWFLRVDSHLNLELLF